jgi:hypothetical protein
MLHLVVMHSHVGADMDGLAYSLRYPTNCGWQTKGLCCLKCVVPSRRSAVGGVELLCGVFYHGPP